jgi:GH15 family glucan-1,4-alpha-glucosidase
MPNAEPATESLISPPTSEADYRPIGDYAIVGDGRTAALVSRTGSIDWLCLPSFASPSLFAAILDRQRGGRFGIRPSGPFTSRRRYLGDSPVLETTFETAVGTVRVTDFMPVLAGSPLARDIASERELVRIVEGVSGAVELDIVFVPRPDYGRRPVRLVERGKLGWFSVERDRAYILHSDVPFRPCDGASALGCRLRVAAGEKRYLSLVFACDDVAAIAPLGVHADARLEATLAWWERWSGLCPYRGPYRTEVMRSVLVLKLLTYALSGAVVAAPTASLPEAIGAARNWDYRFTWLRDASLTLRAFVDLGHRAEGAVFLDWLLNTTRLTRPCLQVLYDVYGRTRMHEEDLDHFEGYRGSRPVRIGNAAETQLQLDVYGSVVMAAHDYVVRGGRLDRFERRMLTGFGKVVCDRWREPDNGIWEIRGGRRHHVHSKMMCWVALDRLLRLAADGHVRIPRDRVERERAAVAEAIETDGFDPDLNAYVAAFGNREPDAALLLMARFGYKDPSDPRMVGTYDFLRRELGRGPLIMRYRHGYDGMPSPEGAFGICSFWQVDYLARRGDVQEAVRLFDRLLDYANDLGLFAEEIDPDTGEALGNFPQAFTHVGLIAAALTLERAGVRG